jgi:hypothetical protein
MAANRRTGCHSHTRHVKRADDSSRTSQGYALGEYPVPEAIAKLLRLMIKLGIKPDDVR